MPTYQLVCIVVTATCLVTREVQKVIFTDLKSPRPSLRNVQLWCSQGANLPGQLTCMIIGPLVSFRKCVNYHGQFFNLTIFQLNGKVHFLNLYNFWESYLIWERTIITWNVDILIPAASSAAKRKRCSIKKDVKTITTSHSKRMQPSVNRSLWQTSGWFSLSSFCSW